MTANSLLFVKSHVNAFTRKDGTFVAAHDDKRVAAAPSVPSHNMASFDKDWSNSVEYHGSEQKAAFAKGWQHENTKAKTGEVGREPTSRHLGDLSVHYKAGKAAAQRKIKLSGDADSGAHSAFDQHIDAYNAAGGQSSQPRTARPKNKAARAHSGSGAGNLVDHTAPANASDGPSTSSAYVSRFSTLEGAKKYQSNNAKPTKVFHHPDGGFFVPPHARSSSQYEKAGHKVALHYNGKPPASDS